MKQMTIADEIKKDHDETRAMMAKIQKTAAKETEDRRKKFLALKREVFAHFKAEEGTILPEMMKIDEVKPLATELMKDHKEIREKFEDVTSTKGDDASWISRFAPLAEQLSEHMDKEEKKAPPTAPKYFTRAQLEELGKVFEKIESKEKGQVITA